MPRRAPQRLRVGKTLHARASAINPEQQEEYYEEQEPSMRFTHALIVVLILHIIAVGGIFGFNFIKAKQIVSARSQEKSSAFQPPTAGQSAQDNADTGNQPSAPRRRPLSSNGN